MSFVHIAIVYKFTVMVLYEPDIRSTAKLTIGLLSASVVTCRLL